MILILNGPNLNLLGTRQPEIYGHTTLADLEALCQDWAEELGLSINFQQSNYEGQLIDWIHAAREQEVKGIVINPGGYTHTSVAIRDAIAGVGIPAIEVHISNVFAREPFRHHSYIAPVCIGSIAGLGMEGYKAALMKFQALLGQPRDHFPTQKLRNTRSITSSETSLPMIWASASSAPSIDTPARSSGATRAS